MTETKTVTQEERERELSSLLIEGFDDTKLQQQSTFDKGTMAVIRAKQNDLFLKAEVFSFETHDVEMQGKTQKMRVAVLRIEEDENRTVKGILPFELSGESDRNYFKNLFGRKIHVMVEQYERNEDGTVTFIGNRQRAKELAQDLLFRKVEEGDIIPAVVQFVSDRFVFLDIGGVTAQLGARDLSYEWIPSLPNKYRIGDHLKVKVVSLDKEKKEIRVSAKATMPNVWETIIPTQYTRGKEVVGEVTGVMDYGYFVNLEAGVDVLCKHLRHQVIDVGTRVGVRIDEVQLKNQKMLGHIVKILNM